MLGMLLFEPAVMASDYDGSDDTPPPTISRPQKSRPSTGSEELQPPSGHPMMSFLSG